MIVVGVLLTMSTFFGGLRDASVLGFAQSAVGVLVTLDLLRALRKGKRPPDGQRGASNPDKNARALALSLVIAIVAPILFLWWVTSSVGPR